MESNFLNLSIFQVSKISNLKMNLSRFNNFSHKSRNSLQSNQKHINHKPRFHLWMNKLMSILRGILKNIYLILNTWAGGVLKVVSRFAIRAVSCLGSSTSHTFGRALMTTSTFKVITRCASQATSEWGAGLARGNAWFANGGIQIIASLTFWTISISWSFTNCAWGLTFCTSMSRRLQIVSTLAGFTICSW